MKNKIVILLILILSLVFVWSFDSISKGQHKIYVKAKNIKEYSKETNKHSIMCIIGKRRHCKDPKTLHPLATGKDFEEKMHRSYVLFAKDWGLKELHCSISPKAEQYNQYTKSQYKDFLKNIIIDVRYILDQAEISKIAIYLHIETPAGKYNDVKKMYYAGTYDPDHPDYTQENFWKNDTYVREGFIIPVKKIVDTFGSNGTEPKSSFKSIGFTHEPRSGGGVPKRTYILPTTWIKYNEEMVDYLAVNSPQTVWQMTISYGGALDSKKTDLTDKLRNGNVAFFVCDWDPFRYTFPSKRCKPPRYCYSYNHWYNGENGNWKRRSVSSRRYASIEKWRLSNKIPASRIYASAGSDISSTDGYKYYRDRFAAANSYGYNVSLGNIGSSHHAFSSRYSVINCSADPYRNPDKFAKYNPTNRVFQTIIGLITGNLKYSQSENLFNDSELTDISKWDSLPSAFNHTKGLMGVNNSSSSSQFANSPLTIESLKSGKTYQIIIKFSHNTGSGKLMAGIGEKYVDIVLPGERDNVYAGELTLDIVHNNKFTLLAKPGCRMNLEYIKLYEINLK